MVYVPLDTELVDEPSLTGTVSYMYVSLDCGGRRSFDFYGSLCWSSLCSSRLPGGKTGSAKSLRVAGRGVSVATCPSVGRSVVFGRYGLA